MDDTAPLLIMAVHGVTVPGCGLSVIGCSVCLPSKILGWRVSISGDVLGVFIVSFFWCTETCFFCGASDLSFLCGVFLVFN